MATPLDEYKALIDGLAQLGPCVKGSWVRAKRSWPNLPENKPINAFLRKLTTEQRDVLAGLLDAAFEEGIHAALAHLNDEIGMNDLRLSRGGRKLPVEPFGTELYFDWSARRDGRDWPEPTDG